MTGQQQKPENDENSHWQNRPPASSPICPMSPISPIPKKGILQPGSCSAKRIRPTRTIPPWKIQPRRSQSQSVAVIKSLKRRDHPPSPNYGQVCRRGISRARGERFQAALPGAESLRILQTIFSNTRRPLFCMNGYGALRLPCIGSANVCTRSAG